MVQHRRNREIFSLISGKKLVFWEDFMKKEKVGKGFC